MIIKQGDLICIRRRSLSISQDELGGHIFSQDANVNTVRNKIKNIELGQRRVTPDELAAIADALKCETDELQEIDTGLRKSAGLPIGFSTCQHTAMLWQPMSDSTPPPCLVGSQNQGS